MKHFCVVGSVNMDMVTRVARFPMPGETISGISFSIFPGGKGANQAVALARLGARVEMVGATGDDVLGEQYSGVFSGLGIGTSGVRRMAGTSTGTASIEVSASGENHIIIVPGANAEVTPDLVEANREVISTAAFLLLQLEIPMDSVVRAAHIAHDAGVPVILDPAPARDIPAALFPLVTVITPNETEARILTGEDTSSEAGIAKACLELRSRGAAVALVKAGGRGAYVVEGSSLAKVPGYAVKVVDTVAAGDSFNAGLALALGEGRSLWDAVRFANAVGAISVTREGAQSAMPARAEVEALMAGSDNQ